MKRRTALALIATLPAAAEPAKKTAKGERKKAAKRLTALTLNSPQYYEAQVLSLFVAMMVSRKDNVGNVNYWVDKFAASKGVRDAKDDYFAYTSDGAFRHAFDLLVTKGQYKSLIAFQKEYRKFSVDMVSYLKSSVGGAAAGDPYPDICPFDENTTAILDALQP
jgi:hypothetical protein